MGKAAFRKTLPNPNSRLDCPPHQGPIGWQSAGLEATLLNRGVTGPARHLQTAGASQ